MEGEYTLHGSMFCLAPTLNEVFLTQSDEKGDNSYVPNVFFVENKLKLSDTCSFLASSQVSFGGYS